LQRFKRALRIPSSIPQFVETVAVSLEGLLLDWGTLGGNIAVRRWVRRLVFEIKLRVGLVLQEIEFLNDIFRK